MTDRQNSSSSTDGTDLVDVVTVLHDQLDNVPLLQLRGAVVLPRGTIVALADGTAVQVQSYHLIAPRTGSEPARLVARVVRVSGDRPERG
ncbi:hypothetical protein [Actinophytocola algeriensis]|uniref:Uncharacterized protein n=1 Tax=Actinophytocola algeriensis TaxID=1768010 RepID=A0A7W7QDM7_9PSEU|nr:hypothetical protein [Actinophytocola algeriensis]MBB4911604.1 hypothetical protein [Actinophytocola algeriensis]MBE1473408.1 hypothetical protein [Actinophytocola algeriensis]